MDLLQTITNEQLVTKLQQGDNDAFTQLYEGCYRMVYFHALKITGNETIAENVTQDVFIEIFKSIGNIKDSKALRSWIGGIAVNLSNKALNDKVSRHEVIIEDEMMLNLLDRDYERNPTVKRLEERESAIVLGQLIDELPLEQKSVVLMYYYDECSIKDISRVFACSENTIKSRLNYARQTLRKKIESYEHKGQFQLYSFTPAILQLALRMQLQDLPVTDAQIKAGLSVIRSIIGVGAAGTAVTTGTAGVAGITGGAGGTVSTASAAAVTTGAAVTSEAVIGAGILTASSAKVIAVIAAGALTVGSIAADVHQNAPKEEFSQEYSAIIEDIPTGDDLAVLEIANEEFKSVSKKMYSTNGSFWYEDFLSYDQDGGVLTLSRGSGESMDVILQFRNQYENGKIVGGTADHIYPEYEYWSSTVPFSLQYDADDRVVRIEIGDKDSSAFMQIVEIQYNDTGVPQYAKTDVYETYNNVLFATKEMVFDEYGNWIDFVLRDYAYSNGEIMNEPDSLREIVLDEDHQVIHMKNADGGNSETDYEYTILPGNAYGNTPPVFIELLLDSFENSPT